MHNVNYRHILNKLLANNHITPNAYFKFNTYNSHGTARTVILKFRKLNMDVQIIGVQRPG